MNVTVGIIAFNALPWLKYSLQCCYDFADKIIIVEGAVPAAQDMAGQYGTSIDGTVEFLEGIEDPKIEIIHGQWKDKTEMSNVYFKRAKEGYVWQIDSDECYHPEEMETILKYCIDNNIRITNTPVIQFWKNTNTCLQGGMFDIFAPRIFKKNTWDIFIDHRPPKILTQDGVTISLSDHHHSKPSYLLDKKLYMYHYSWIGDQKVRQKCKFFENLRPEDPRYGTHFSWWYPNVWEAWDNDPEDIEIRYGLHVTGGGRTFPFDGKHPKPIQEAIDRGEIK